MDLILLRPGWPEGFGVGGIDEDGCCEEWVVVERSCDVLVRMGIEGGNWKECCPVRISGISGIGHSFCLG